VNKFFRIIGFGLFFISVFLVILGFYSLSEIQISQTQYLQAPTTLIWQHITNEEKFGDWIFQLPIQDCVVDTNNIIICYSDTVHKNKIFTIQKDLESKSINFTLDEKWHNPFIYDYSLMIHLKSLRDGTTEINCTLQYRLKNIMARVINKLYFEGYQKNLMEKNVEFLQKHFGRA